MQGADAIKVLREVNARRMEIAEGFTALAAIEAGAGKVTMEYPVPGTAEDPEAQP